MATEIETLKLFKNTLIEFIDEIVEIFPNENDLIVVRIFLKDQIPIKQVIDNFILKLNKPIINSGNTNDNDVLTARKMVKNKDDLFFLKNNILFEELGSDKVNHFKKLWKSERLTKDDRETIWAWVNALIILSDKYVKLNKNNNN